MDAFSLFAILCLISENSCWHDEEKLFEELFCRRNISSQVRPVFNKSKPIIVHTDLSYVQLVKLDDSEQILESNIIYRQFWVNEFLMWNPKDYGGIERIIFNNSFAWKPDIILYNGMDELGQLDTHKTRVEMNASGHVIWYIPTHVKSACNIRNYYFPFDYQRCVLKFGSWTSPKYLVDLVPLSEEVNMKMYLLSTDFEIVDTRVVREERNFTCCKQPFVTVSYSLVLKRNSMFHTKYLLLPSVILYTFGMIIITFPVRVGERLSLAMDCMFSLVILAIGTSKMTPVDSENQPLIGRVMNVAIMTVFFSIFLNCVSINLGITNTSVPSTLLRYLLSTRLSQSLLCRFRVLQSSRTDYSVRYMNNVAMQVLAKNSRKQDGQSIVQKKTSFNDEIAQERRNRIVQKQRTLSRQIALGHRLGKHILNNGNLKTYCQHRKSIRLQDELLSRNIRQRVVRHYPHAAYRELSCNARGPYTTSKYLKRRRHLPQIPDLSEECRRQNSIDLHNINHVLLSRARDKSTLDNAMFWQVVSQTTDRMFFGLFNVGYVFIAFYYLHLLR